MFMLVKWFVAPARMPHWQALPEAERKQVARQCEKNLWATPGFVWRALAAYGVLLAYLSSLYACLFWLIFTWGDGIFILLLYCLIAWCAYKLSMRITNLLVGDPLVDQSQTILTAHPRFRTGRYCPNCDYDQRGSPQSNCPECGSELVAVAAAGDG